MSIKVENNVKNKENNELFEQNTHYIPCKIDEDGPANVNKYFHTYIKEDNGDLKSTFRGHLLNGMKMELPKGYRALIATETKKPLSEDADRRLQVTSGFKSFTRWNWDKRATNNDTMVQAMDWIDIAKAIHAD